MVMKPRGVGYVRGVVDYKGKVHHRGYLTLRFANVGWLDITKSMDTQMVVKNGIQ